MILTLLGVSANAFAGDTESSKAMWKAGQLKYVECVVNETEKHAGLGVSAASTAQQAIVVCDMQLYNVGMAYMTWLKNTSMAAGDISKEVMRFVSTTRDSTRMSMTGSVAVMRAVHQSGITSEPPALLAYEVR